MKGGKKAPALAVMIGLSKARKDREEGGEAHGEGSAGLDEDESPVSPEHASEEDEGSGADADDEDSDHLGAAEEHGASALVDAIGSGDPKAVASAFRTMYTACHLRHQEEDEG
jgi:hypothetical protein